MPEAASWVWGGHGAASKQCAFSSQEMYSPAAVLSGDSHMLSQLVSTIIPGETGTRIYSILEYYLSFSKLLIVTGLENGEF